MILPQLLDLEASPKIASFVQSARCPVVSQPNLAALLLGTRGRGL